MNLFHNISLYRRLYIVQLNSRMEYKLDFVITLVTVIFQSLLGFIFLYVLFSKIPRVHGWSYYQVVLVYAIVLLTEGFVSFFLEGMWRMSYMIDSGDLDKFLVRPIPIFTQIVTASVGINGIGNLSVGTFLMILSLIHTTLEWTRLQLAIFIVLLILGIVIRSTIMFAVNCGAFFLRNIGPAFPLLFNSMADFVKYPMSIFAKPIQVVFTAIVPYGFISYYPSYFLFHTQSSIWVLVGSPLATIGCLLVAYAIFRMGLSHYDSVGS